MSDQRPTSTLIEMSAKSDFEKAIRKGFWRSIWTWFTQRDNNLLPFEEIRKALPISGQHDAGMQEIPLDQIVGSVGRYQDFDKAFLPRHQFMSGRWVSIDKAHYQDVVLPPIEVYKIGEVYFVRDGNHRVSVARQRGQAFIDAYVTIISTPVAITPATNVDDLIRQIERLTFFQKSGLDKLRPDAAIEFTLPGGYTKALEHIDVHRYFMGLARNEPVEYAEAVGDWYDSVYMPMVKVIESRNVLNDFPGRTIADLYIWIIEHLWFLREEYQHEVSLEEAAAHYTKEFSTHSGPFSWLMGFVKWALLHTGESEGPKSPPEQK